MPDQMATQVSRFRREDDSGDFWLWAGGGVIVAGVLIVLNWDWIKGFLPGAGPGPGPGPGEDVTVRQLLGANGGKGETFPHGDDDMYLDYYCIGTICWSPCVKLVNPHTRPVKVTYLGVADGFPMGGKVYAPGESFSECGIKRVANAEFA